MSSRLVWSMLSFTLAMSSFAVEAAAQTTSPPCVDPEAQMLRQLKQKEGPNGPHAEKLESLALLEAGEAKCREEQKLSREEKAKLAAQKLELYRENLQKLEERAKAASPSEALTGIFEIAPSPEEKDTFIPENVWQSETDTVAAGANYENPMQGEVIVYTDPGDMGLQSNVISTPTATGPVRIVSEVNGVLTLESLAGKYRPMHNGQLTNEVVETPGGARYHFSVRTNKFQELSERKSMLPPSDTTSVISRPSGRITSQ